MLVPMGTPNSAATMTGFNAEQQQALFEQQQILLNLQIQQLKESHKHTKEKHTAELAVLRSGMKTGNAEQPEPEGELKPQVLDISKLLPGVPRSLLSSILEEKFDPYNLYKLRAVHSDDYSDKQRFSLDTNGEFKLEKAKGKLKDFGLINVI